MNIYEVEFYENKDFRRTTKLVNAFNEPSGTKSVNVLIPLQFKEICVMQIQVDNQVTRERITKAIVRADKGTGQSFLLIEKSQGVYEGLLPLGDF